MGSIQARATMLFEPATKTGYNVFLRSACEQGWIAFVSCRLTRLVDRPATTWVVRDASDSMIGLRSWTLLTAEARCPRGRIGSLDDSCSLQSG